MNHRNIKILLFGFIIVLLYGCEKDPVIEPKIHDAKEFDLNNDFVNDIKIFYSSYSWDGIGPNGSGMGISGIIKPLNDNKILSKQDIGSLFLNPNDTIKTIEAEPFSWTSNDSYVINIETHLNQYVNPWIINAPEVKDQYFIGFKLTKDNSTSLGWLKLRINSYNGKIDVIDKMVSAENFIVID